MVAWNRAFHWRPTPRHDNRDWRRHADPRIHCACRAPPPHATTALIKIEVALWLVALLRARQLKGEPKLKLTWTWKIFFAVLQCQFFETLWAFSRDLLVLDLFHFYLLVRPYICIPKVFQKRSGSRSPIGRGAQIAFYKSTDNQPENYSCRLNSALQELWPPQADRVLQE